MINLADLDIKVKILLLTLVVSLSLIIGLVSLSSLSTTKIIKEVVIEQERENVNLSANLISGWLREQKKDLQIYANTELMKSGTWQERKRYLQEELVHRGGEFFFFFIADETGDYNTTQINEAGNIRDRNYFAQVMNGQTVVSEPLISRSTGKPIIVIATPITNNGQPDGLLGAVIRLEEFTDYINQFNKDSHEAASYVIDGQGIIMAHPQKNKILQNYTELTSWESEVFSNLESEISQERFVQGSNYFFYQVIPGTANWRLIVKIPEESLISPVMKTNRRLLILGLAALLIVIIVSLLIARRISQPIIKLRDIFNRGVEGDLSVRADLDRKDEIGQAAASFNQMMEKINNLKYNDPVTGVANINYFKEQLTADLAQLDLAEDNLAVFAVGVDNLKDVNDSFGYVVGDEILRSIADRLRNCTEQEEIISRISDEFFLYITGVNKEQEIINLGQELLDKINRSYCVKGEEIYLTSSIGIAVYPEDSKEAEKLIKNASMAMHLAKNKQEKQIKCYSANIEAQLSEKLSLETKLITALEQDQFCLYYQPLLAVQTGEIKGMEALIRWQHPAEGMISPGKFIPLAEKNGLIIEIGAWVLRQACQQLKKWHQAGYDNLRMSVNIAPQQFQSSGFITTVREILSETGVKAEYLELEITERAAIKNVEYTIATLEELKALGVKIAIDDFGTGYSSLSYLKEFALHTLKIDRSFINELTNEQQNTAIAETIITIGHNLGLEVVAEGVETEEQLKFLQQKDCDLVQGYYFSWPVDAGDFGQLLTKNNLID